MAFTVYTGSNNSTLTNALLALNSGIVIDPNSITLQASGQDAVNFYDGSLSPLGIGAGLLLTSGTTPGTSNTMPWFGTDNSTANTFYNGDADINAVVNSVFQTQSYDATTLSFDFTVADPNATSVSFDVVFGSDEFPEWVDQFVDCAVVMVNGVNYALFNHDPLHPLSVVSSNLAAGYFQDNAGNVLPIEYDGVSHVLKIVAPIIPGGATNHIKIGIADTGDHIYDSGIFISNLSAGNIPGSGVVSQTTGTCTDGNDTVTGSSQAEYFNLKGGDDTVYAGAGDDIVVAGSGNDNVYGGSGADEMKGDAGDDYLDGGADSDTAVYAGNKADFAIAFDSASGKYTVAGPSSEGADILTGVEFVKFSDSLWSLDATGTVSLVVPPSPVVIPANQPGTVFISGIAGQGQMLTATVSDVDGVPASGVTFAWQANGVDLGVSGNTFVVGAAQVGQNITATADYTDLAGYSESLISTAKYISAPGNGDFTITLLNLSAPIGASVMNPLTTLIKNAIDLGASPNEAALIVKSALGLDPTINLQHYDSWAALQANPGDAAALAVEKKAVQVAVMTSLGSDETGMALTQAILLAHSNNTTLNLADTTVIANLLGLDPASLLVHEIWDRNDTIGSAKTVDGINTIWLDMQSGLDVVLSDSIGTLSMHINQAPTGTATASLVSGLENTDYIINATDLLQGFSDADGDALSVSGLSADNGTVTDNGDGTFTITPTLDYTGPVELTYTVDDGLGGSAPASQLFVFAPNPTAPVNTAPTGAATATLAAGTEDTAYTVNASDLLAGFSDIDGDTLNVADLVASNGTVVDNGNGTFTITPALNFNGAVSLSYNVIDGNGGSVGATQSYILAAVNDAPTGAAAAVLASGMEDTAYTVSASNLLAGFSDVDGDTLSVSALSASNGTVVDNGDGTFTITPALNFNGAVSLSYNVIDGNGGSVGATQNYTLAAVNDAPTGGVAITGTASLGQTLTAANTLADADGLGTIGYQWQASGTNISGATGSSYTLTSGEVGKAITVVASYTDGSGTAEAISSAATDAVANVTASIGNRVWSDTNFNGIQDAGEAGISGVTVNLLNAGGTVLGTTTTDANGNYLFANLNTGDYKVQVVKPSGYYYTKSNIGADDSIDSDVDSNGMTAVANLAAGTNDLTWDAGLYQKASIGDRVWNDKDGDGIQDLKETGIGNIKVSLQDASGTTIATTTTSKSGNYSFANLDPGSYRLVFDKTSTTYNTKKWSAQDIGANDAIDSDAYSTGSVATTAYTTLTSGENDMTWDAGITPIVIDLNGDGIHTVSRSSSTGSFDLLGNGNPIQSGWLSGNDGFLVVDRNGNGRIDDISEMFGGTAKGAGFAKLAAYDSNGDGVVNADDAGFADLRIWQDANGNHQTDAGELMTLAQAGVSGLKVGYDELPFLDANGNLHLERSSATLADGTAVDMTDVYFNVSAADAAAAGVELPSMANLLSGSSSLDGLLAGSTSPAAPASSAGNSGMDFDTSVLDAMKQLAHLYDQAVVHA